MTSHFNNVIPNDDDDVDTFIQKMKEKQEIDDYIANGRYPDRLKTTFVKKHFPILDETFIHEPIELHNSEIEHLNNNIDKIRQTLNTLEREVRTELQRELTQSNNHSDCPICMEEITDRNYVMPSCGHSVCVQCFLLNIKTNNHTGHLCSQCRQPII